MDTYKCEKCGSLFSEFEMNYKETQIDKMTMCNKCRESKPEPRLGEPKANEFGKGDLPISIKPEAVKPEAEGDALDNILSQFMCPEDAADYKVMIRKALTGDIVDEFVERLLKNVQTTNILTPNHGNSWVSKKDILEIARQAKGSANEQAEQEV